MKISYTLHSNYEHHEKEETFRRILKILYYIIASVTAQTMPQGVYELATHFASHTTSKRSWLPDPRAVCNFGAQGRSSAVPPADRLTSRGAQRCGWQAGSGRLASSRGAAIGGYRGCLSAPCPRVETIIARPRGVEFGTTGFRQKMTSAAVGCRCVAVVSTLPQRGCVPCTSLHIAMSGTWSMNCWDFPQEAASSGGLCQTAPCPSVCHLLSANWSSHVNASNKWTVRSAGDANPGPHSAKKMKRRWIVTSPATTIFSSR